MRRKVALCRVLVIAMGIALLPAISFSQTYSPIPVTGYNQDVVAETGTSSLTTTTICVDGVTISNKVMYSVAFRTANGFGGGGLPDNGTITSGSMTFQMAGFGGNNCALIPRNQTATLTLTTPATYTALRLLCYSTEGTSQVSAVINFSDGTTSAVPAFTVNDWFNNSTNLVLSGFGRCTRSTPATGAGDYPTNPNLYYANIPVACADRGKNIQSITLNNVTTAGSNAPFPNACFFAVSGVNFSATAAVTNASCSTGGSATLTISGPAAPYNVTWNTVPVQTGNTATNLAPGTYNATITGTDGCAVVIPVTIAGGTNTVTLTGNTSTAICAGSSFNTTTTSNATTYAWTANTSAAVAGISNAAIANPVLTPTQTTIYTLTASTGSCSQTNSFTITVNPLPTISTRGPLNLCTGGAGATPGLTSTGTSFSWAPTTGLSSSTILNPVINPTATTPYVVTATLGTCTATSSFSAVVTSATANAGTGVTIQKGASTTLNGTGSAGTYLWTPATGLSNTTILTPVATPQATTTYTLQVTTAANCVATSSVTVTVLFDCIRDFSAFTPNGDGFYDKWVLTNGLSCTKNITVNVYNRYGSKVYESKNYNNDWDGTYKGKPVPDGTYYYNISFTMADGSLRVAKGPVAIIR